ncbi:adenosylcobinamide-phosphate synthase CbiB [Thalassococcus sp. BH17M4-6]|uniref:adenosylcobinamide-phosphate synthase CbiB n=1 Tax=Thalassococcus sp. BH17M4-6 TaxID=3413148 RepID=UPI003BD5BFDB
MSFAAMMLIGLCLDAALGWPAAVYARIGHPVTWLGKLVSSCERRWNHGPRDRRLRMGAVTLSVCVIAVILPARLVQAALPDGAVGLILTGVLAWPLIAVRSMHDHVRHVALPLAAGDLTAARQAVAMIVGRDPGQLDDAGVARAATESLAENTSDGIVAPIFWGCVAGLPGIAAYKAINTLDSMIGHRSDRYEAFGKFAARMDDVVNWAPARLTALLFALTSGRAAGRALRVVLADARHHRSPNAGWPEAAMAGALNVRLSGPRLYGDVIAEEPFVNAAAPDPSPSDVARGLALYRRSMVLLAAGLAVIALA